MKTLLLAGVAALSVLSASGAHAYEVEYAGKWCFAKDAPSETYWQYFEHGDCVSLVVKPNGDWSMSYDLKCKAKSPTPRGNTNYSCTKIDEGGGKHQFNQICKWKLNSETGLLGRIYY